jgi:hypothetical protein
MATELKKEKEIELEIAHVLFLDIVGYSKLSVNEQHARVDELNGIVRLSEQFQKAEAANRFNGDGTTFNPFGTVNIGGTVIIDATGGVGTYTVAADCTAPCQSPAPNFQYICRAGCTEGLDSRDFSQSCRPRSERRNGDTAARAVKRGKKGWRVISGSNESQRCNVRRSRSCRDPNAW